MGSRCLYPIAELELFQESCLRKSTSDPGPTQKTAQAGKQTATVRQIKGQNEIAPSGLAPITGQGGQSDDNPYFYLA
jgi:hypothetical protein